jgi:ABC-type transport system involved in multi-copper enzyme maturation permease subunit
MIEPIKTIALVTFRESMRSKVLYSLFLFAVLLIAASVFFGTVSIGDRAQVVKDFGLFSISLLTALYVVIAGSTLVHKELSRRTVYNILSRPIARWQFVVGKYFGLLLTTATLVVLMLACFLTFVMLFEGEFDPLLIVAGVHILLEVSIVCAVTILFSALVVTPMLSGMFSFGVFLVGRSSGVLENFLLLESTGGFRGYLLKLIYLLLPNLEMLNISNMVVYGLAPTVPQCLWSVGYSMVYGAALLVVGCWIFKKREFR